MFQYSCLETPFSDKEAWQATVYRVTKSWTWTKWPCTHSCKAFFFFCLWELCPSESWVWRWHSCLACRNPGGAKCAETQTAFATGVMTLSQAFFASCSWRSEGLFGQYLSIALPIQALRGFPCLGSFSIVWCVRHIEGASRLRSYSVGQCIRHLKEHLGWGPTL